MPGGSDWTLLYQTAVATKFRIVKIDADVLCLHRLPTSIILDFRGTETLGAFSNQIILFTVLYNVTEQMGGVQRDDRLKKWFHAYKTKPIQFFLQMDRGPIKLQGFGLRRT